VNHYVIPARNHPKILAKLHRSEAKFFGNDCARWDDTVGIPIMQSFNPSALVEAARKVQKKIPLGENFTAGGVGAAILAKNRKIYTGICIDLACGIGFCAEHAAIAEMLKDCETVIEAAVAVNENKILPPCGRCREMMLQINPQNKDTKIVLSDTKIMTSDQLLPEHWLTETGTKIT